MDSLEKNVVFVQFIDLVNFGLIVEKGQVMRLEPDSVVLRIRQFTIEHDTSSVD